MQVSPHKAENLSASVSVGFNSMQCVRSTCHFMTCHDFIPLGGTSCIITELVTHHLSVSRSFENNDPTAEIGWMELPSRRRPDRPSTDPRDCSASESQAFIWGKRVLTIVTLKNTSFKRAFCFKGHAENQKRASKEDMASRSGGKHRLTVFGLVYIFLEHLSSCSSAKTQARGRVLLPSETLNVGRKPSARCVRLNRCSLMSMTALISTALIRDKYKA